MPKLKLDELPVRNGSGYPSPYDEPCRLRSTIDLAKAGALTQFGAKIVTLSPGSWSSQRHWHSHEDELIFLISGDAVFVDDNGPQRLVAGDVTVHPGGDGNGHHIKNESDADVVYLVVGTHAPEKDHGHYPDIDMDIPANGTANRVFLRKDGSSFSD